MSYQVFLHTFLAAYRLGSQVSAAKSLAITQPAVSQHIKSLEHHLGKPLFKREGRKLVPTTAANQLALKISEPISQLDAVLKQAQPGYDPLAGEVLMGGLMPFFAKMIVPLLPKLFSHDIQLRFEYGFDDLITKLLNNELDIAQLTTHVTHPQIEQTKIYQQQFVLVGHPHFLSSIKKAQLKKNDVSSLTELPWIIYDGSLLFINEYFQSVFEQNFNGKVKLVVPDLWAMLEACINGIGITILPSFFCKEEIDNQKLSVLFDSPRAPSHYLYLGWKKGALHNPKVKLVRDILMSLEDTSIPNTPK